MSEFWLAKFTFVNDTLLKIILSLQVSVMYFLVRPR